MALIPPFLLPSIIPVTVAFAALSFNLQKRVLRTSEMRSKRVPKVVPFLVPFWSQFWPQNGPQNSPKFSPKINNFGAHFWIPFLLELFGSLFGAFLGLLRLSWEAFGPQKPKKTNEFVRFLQMQLFGSSELLMALLVPSWRLPVPIWSQN